MLWPIILLLLCSQCRAANVAIIGASGYVGSRLFDYLEASGLSVTGYDRDVRDKARNVTELASYDMQPSLIQSYDAIVYLGGLTGRVACDTQPNKVTKENVEDVVSFAKQMKSNQLFIFASTSAVTEGSGSVPATETSSIQASQLDLYAKSMADREVALQKVALEASPPTMVGLRFGTVIGLSPSQRTEFLHIVFTCQAHLTGRISVKNPDSYRAMLYLEDLVRAIQAVISKPPAAKFSVYHLSSFATSVGAAATEVAKQVRSMCL